MSAGGAAAAVAQAIKASGAVVRLPPADFASILARQQEPLVVMATGGILRTTHRYLAGYKGLIFFTKSPEPLSLPRGAEVVRARSIWIPT